MMGIPRVPIEELGVEYPSLCSKTGCDRMLRKYVDPLPTAMCDGMALGIDWLLRTECVERCDRTECTDSNVFAVTADDRDCVDCPDIIESIDS